MAVEASFLLGLLILYDSRGYSSDAYVLNNPPGNYCLMVKLINRLFDNGPAARRLASHRLADTVASGLPLVMYFLMR